MKESMDAAAERAFAERYAAAVRHLRGAMEALGLHETQGWRISETTQEAANGSRMLLRPIHSRLAAPPDVECIVWIDEDSGAVDADCSPGGRPL
jgi:hypothetical protein